MTGELWGFAVVALLLVMTPGPDFAVVVPNAAASRAAGAMTALGTGSGLAVHALIAALGLSAIVLASDVAFSVVKYAGAAVLLYLGIRAIVKSRRSHKTPPDANSSSATGRAIPSRAAAFRQGLFVNVLNPKAPLIYLSVMPQFLDTSSSAQPQLLAMSAILVGLALTWYLALTALVSYLRPLVLRFGRWIDRITGAILIALGVRLAFESRPI